MAIARDAISQGASNGQSTLTFSHTCSGSDRILFVSLGQGASNSASGVTYNSTAMTRVNTQNVSGTTFMNMSIWYLVAPSTGANNIVVTNGGTGFNWALASSYTGVDQSSPINPSGGNTGVATASSLAVSITTGADNEWIYGIAMSGSSDSAFTAGTNTSLLAMNVNGWDGHFDTNSAQTPAGSKTVNINRASSGLFGMNIVAFAPVGSAPTINSNFFNLF